MPNRKLFININKMNLIADEEVSPSPSWKPRVTPMLQSTNIPWPPQADAHYSMVPWTLLTMSVIMPPLKSPTGAPLVQWSQVWPAHPSAALCPVVRQVLDNLVMVNKDMAVMAVTGLDPASISTRYCCPSCQNQIKIFDWSVLAYNILINLIWAYNI